jgi:ferredoxin
VTHVDIDNSVCQGYGNCVGAAPEVFDLGNSGQAFVLRDPVDDDERRRVRQTVSLCPVNAIHVQD